MRTVRHILRLAHPERFVLVELLPLVGHLFHLLRFLFPIVFLLFFVNFLNLRLIALFALLVLLFLLIFLGISHLLLLRLLNVQLNGETNELSVLLHKILQSAILQELGFVLPQVANDLRVSLAFCTMKDPTAADSQTCCSSSLFLLTTRTLSETKYTE